jgi:hypothetical protein
MGDIGAFNRALEQDLGLATQIFFRRAEVGS